MAKKAKEIKGELPPVTVVLKAPEEEGYEDSCKAYEAEIDKR